jgi:hypothetical protein
MTARVWGFAVLATVAAALLITRTDSGYATRVDRAARPVAAASTVPIAAIGDGVCAQSFKAYGDTVTAPTGLQPQHSKAAAITAGLDYAERFRNTGTVDAYFASVASRDPTTGKRTGNQPAWIVEVSGINIPWGGAPGASPAPTIVLQHGVVIVDDATLKPLSVRACV